VDKFKPNTSFSAVIQLSLRDSLATGARKAQMAQAPTISLWRVRTAMRGVHRTRFLFSGSDAPRRNQDHIMHLAAHR
jgi:hypothetical protein